MVKIYMFMLALLCFAIGLYTYTLDFGTFAKGIIVLLFIVLGMVASIKAVLDI